MDYPIAEMPTGVEHIDRQAPPSIGPGRNQANQEPSSATRVARLPLRAVSPVVARMARLVCHAPTDSIVRRLPGIAAWRASVREADAAPLAPFEQPGVLELAHPAGRLFVMFDLAAYPALDIAAWPARGAATAPADAERALRMAVAGVMLEPLLERLKVLGLTDLRVVRLVRDARGQAARAGFPGIELSLTLDGRAHAAVIDIDPALLPLLEALHASQATHVVQAARHTTDSLPTGPRLLADNLIPGRIVLGAKRLPIETLRALAPGDVLLRALASTLSPVVTGAAEHAAASATAAWGTPGLTRLHAPVTIDKHTLLIVKEPTMNDKFDAAHPGDSLAPDQAESPIDIGELDLPVQFEVDTVALPLSQLYALRPGYVLELSTPVAEAQLKLVTHGQTIGYGELVTVGEHLGIRILRMAHTDGPVQ
ncbi:type III secretion system cytoplasmic ring protein SctQ [Trinickia sp.]|uniref:type III secretion system cytoplasmic ring protein SctQ n=1 Tax=Trinickia sp. TaxID=2571163 RepID=UPI003F80998E